LQASTAVPTKNAQESEKVTSLEIGTEPTSQEAGGSGTNSAIQESSTDFVEEVGVPKTHQKPSQDKSQKFINVLESELNSILLAKDCGKTTIENEKRIAELKKKIATEKQNLKRKKLDAERQKKFRQSKRAALEDICSENPDILKKLKLRNSAGRPNLEKDQPLLLQTIAEIAMFGSSTDERRRNEVIRSCQSLDSLHAELVKKGFSISRMGTYLRLLPRNSNTIEGKRHVSTVPVKLIRAQTDLHKSHVDTSFAVTSIRYLECLASLLGPREVFFMSQDDKARVPIGVTAAKKQAPLLMHLEYRIKLPDHDWVVADRHKLIPSVYAAIVIKEKGMGRPEAVTYSGPTYVAIRSGKHSSSTASTHSADLNTLLDIEAFGSLAKNDVGAVKPILIVTVDGGADENPRYTKVITWAVHHFKEMDLDALFVATNAPGRSAFNRVERRMAPLSHELSGLVLPHDYFGTHLDNSGKTVDEVLEAQNFEKAGQVLGEVWSAMKIDGYPVEARYIPPGEPDLPANQSQTWYKNHVRQSQYLLQIVKCENLECCAIPRSSLRTILPEGFLPPPLMVWQSESGLAAADIASPDGKFLDLFSRLAIRLEPKAAGFKAVPYDFYCPSVRAQLSIRSCKTCGIYHSSKKAMEAHSADLHSSQFCPAPIVRQRPSRVAAQRANELLCIFRDNDEYETAEWLDEDFVELPHKIEQSTKKGTMQIGDISEWLVSPWTTEM